MTPTRVAIVGLNRTGMHLLEQLHFRPDFFVVAVCEADSELRDAAHRLCESVVECPEELVRFDWETVIVCDSTPTDIQPVLQADRSVVLSLPTNLVADEVDEIRRLTMQNDCRLTTLHWSHTDAEFSAAYAALTAEDFGALRTIRRSISSAGLVLPESSSPVEPFEEFAFSDFAQAWDLLQASGWQPNSMAVQAVPLSGMDGEPRGGYLLLLHEPDGVVVEIRRSIRSVISEDTGWQIAGTHRGFRNHSQIVRTAEDEIYELPPEEAVTTDPLASLKTPRSTDALSSALPMLRCFEILQSSWKNGGPIQQFDPTDNHGAV